MVNRVYVEKKPGFDGEAAALAAELRDIVGIAALTGLRLIKRYDVEGADDALFERCIPTVSTNTQISSTLKPVLNSSRLLEPLASNMNSQTIRAETTVYRFSL